MTDTSKGFYTPSGIFIAPSVSENDTISGQKVEAISEADMERIDTLSQEAQHMLKDCETLFGLIEVGLSMGYFNGDSEVIALASMCQRATKAFDDNELRELVTLTMKVRKEVTKRSAYAD